MNNSPSGRVSLLPPLQYAVWFGVAVFASVFQAPQGAAQVKTSSVATSQDCLELVLQASDDPSLTREERIAALDKALLESLSRTGLCGSAGVTGGEGNGTGTGVTGAAGTGTGVTGAAGGGTGVTGAAGTAGGEAANAAGNAPLESLPATGIQGDLPDAESEAVETATIHPAPETGATNGAGGAQANVPGAGGAPGDNGKVPDDIPPSANDDIIAQQLRQAAMDEADPQTRAKLWNEYRRYNNLPVKSAPESAGRSADAGAN